MRAPQVVVVMCHPRNGTAWPHHAGHNSGAYAVRLGHTEYMGNLLADPPEQLRAFVRGGGSIVATHETSLYDEWGARRKNFGLAELFGVDSTGKAEGPMHNSYIRLEHEALPRHPLFAGLEDAPRGYRPDLCRACQRQCRHQRKQSLVQQQHGAD